MIYFSINSTHPSPNPIATGDRASIILIPAVYSSGTCVFIKFMNNLLSSKLCSIYFETGTLSHPSGAVYEVGRLVFSSFYANLLLLQIATNVWTTYLRVLHVLAKDTFGRFLAKDTFGLLQASFLIHYNWKPQHSFNLFLQLHICHSAFIIYFGILHNL